MKFLHTADWHLGHSLHGIQRELEHRHFLTWLLTQLETHRPDALLLAGDVFDTASPPARAEQLLWDTLARARDLLPDLDVVIVGGNHDSALRLQAPAAILRPLRLTIVGTLERDPGQVLDTERLVVPLHDAEGEVAAWALAVPFLRPADLPPGSDDAEDPKVDAVRRIYKEVTRAALARRKPHQPVIALAHCHMAGATVSELSERWIQGGPDGALPEDVFPPEVDYVALGHLHRPQPVGELGRLRYPGSPIPLSLAEHDYPHQILLVDLPAPGDLTVTPLLVPRSVDMIRLPAEGPTPLPRVLEALAELPARGGGDEDHRPFLEVRVAPDQPEPNLRLHVERALEGKEPRLVKLHVLPPDDPRVLGDQIPQAQLSDLDPHEVFARCYRAKHEAAPPDPLRDAFAELLAQVTTEDT